MKLTYLGKSSDGGESPTLYVTDRDSYIVQGYIVTDEETLSKLDIPQGETVVEVYSRLFAFLAEDDVAGVVTTCAPPIVQVRENGNYIVQGARLADDGDRFRLCLPAHEDAIEVPKAAILALLGESACA